MPLDRVPGELVHAFPEVERRGSAGTPPSGRPSGDPARQRDVYQLKITLIEVEPPIWRRLQVPGLLTLDRLHRVFEQAMGWTVDRRHQFAIGERRYGAPDPESSVSGILPEHGVILLDVLPGENMRFVYLHDFGDHWRHEVVVEKIVASDTGLEVPVCLAGERHCPPEDCGGVEGYEDFLAAIRNAHHPLHHATLEWVGGRFDPDAFNLEEVNRALRRRFR